VAVRALVSERSDILKLATGAERSDAQLAEVRAERDEFVAAEKVFARFGERVSTKHAASGPAKATLSGRCARAVLGQ
jgi:hypothetical protein